MVEDPDYEFDCCGKITKWEGYAKNIGTLQFQVWRRVSTYSYLMIGENSVDISVIGKPEIPNLTVRLISETRWPTRNSVD